MTIHDLAPLSMHRINNGNTVICGPGYEGMKFIVTRAYGVPILPKIEASQVDLRGERSSQAGVGSSHVGVRSSHAGVRSSHVEVDALMSG